ncbi:MAG: beta-galactosidase [Candidatus Omnitrophota bacterium]
MRLSRFLNVGYAVMYMVVMCMAALTIYPASTMAETSYVSDFNPDGWWLRNGDSEWYAQEDGSTNSAVFTSTTNVPAGMNGAAAKYGYGVSGGFDAARAHRFLPERAAQEISAGGIATIELSVCLRGCPGPSPFFGLITKAHLVQHNSGNANWTEMAYTNKLGVTMQGYKVAEGVTRTRLVMSADSGNTYESYFFLNPDTVYRLKFSIDASNDKMRLDAKTYSDGSWGKYEQVFDWSDTGVDLKEAGINGMTIQPNHVTYKSEDGTFNDLYPQFDDLEFHSAPKSSAASIGLLTESSNDSTGIIFQSDCETWPTEPADGHWLPQGWEGAFSSKEICTRVGEGNLDIARHSGRYALYCELQSNTTGIKFRWQAKPNTIYLFTGWLQTRMYGLLFRANQAGFKDDKKGEIFLGDSTVFWPEGWHKIEFEVISSPLPGTITLETISWSAQSKFVIDDVSITEVAPWTEIRQIEPPQDEPKLIPQKVGIFEEPGFPAKPIRTATWWKNTLLDAGFQARIVNLEDVCGKESKISDLDVLIMPTGGATPIESHPVLFDLIARGGMILIDGSIRGKIGFESSKSGTDFMGQLIEGVNPFEIVIPGGKVFRNYKGKWASAVYLQQSTPRVYEEPDWHLLTYYHGHVRNSVPWVAKGSMMKLNGRITNLLQSLPAEIGPLNEEITPIIRSSNLREGGANWLEPVPLFSYLDDILIPLYQGIAGEPATWQHGVQNLTTGGESILVRYHTVGQDGGTFVQLGEAAEPILSSPNVSAVVRDIVALQNQRLPGEKPRAWYTQKQELKQEMSNLGDLFFRTRTRITDSVLEDYYSGRLDVFNDRLDSYRQLDQKYRLLLRAVSLADGLDSQNDIGTSYSLRAEIRQKISELNAHLLEAENHLAVPAQLFISYGDRSDAWENGILFGFNNASFGAKSQLDFFRSAAKLGVDWCARFGEALLYSEISPEIRKTGVRVGTNLCGWGYDNRGLSYELPECVGPNYAKTLEACVGWYSSRDDVFMHHLPCELFLGMPTDPAQKGEIEPYRQWLHSRYETIDKINVQWGGNLKSFDEVSLPTALPKTAAARAPWEDWCRFRDEFFGNFAKKMYESLKRGDPNCRVISDWMAPLGYDGHRGTLEPLLSRYCDFDGLHSGVRPDDTWMKFGLAKKPVVNAEWHGSLLLVAGSEMDLATTATSKMWREFAFGQIGWGIFIGGEMSTWYNGTLINADATVRAHGWGIREAVQQMRRVALIVRRGKKLPAEVALFYSVANNHQTAGFKGGGAMQTEFNTGEITSEAFQNLGGLELLLQINGIARDVIWSREMTAEQLGKYKVVFVPPSPYLERESAELLLNYARQGGHLFVLGPETGRFDAYGKSLEAIKTFYGDNLVTTRQPVVYEGRNFLVPKSDTPLSFVPSILKGSTVRVRFCDGRPAIVTTPYGKGYVTLSGIDFGQEIVTRYMGMEPELFFLIQGVLADAGEKPWMQADSSLLLQRREFDGKIYVIVANREQSDLVQVKELKFTGNWIIRDLLLKHDIPSRVSDGMTVVKLPVPAAAGRVLELIPADIK